MLDSVQLPVSIAVEDVEFRKLLGEVVAQSAGVDVFSQPVILSPMSSLSAVSVVASEPPLAFGASAPASTAAESSTVPAVPAHSVSMGISSTSLQFKACNRLEVLPVGSLSWRKDRGVHVFLLPMLLLSRRGDLRQKYRGLVSAPTKILVVLVHPNTEDRRTDVNLLLCLLHSTNCSRSFFVVVPRIVVVVELAAGWCDVAVEDDSSAAADDLTKKPTGRSVVLPCCAELSASFVFTFFACIY